MEKTKLTTEQYNDLKRFAVLFIQRFYYDLGAPTNGDFKTLLEEMEKKSPANAAKGLMLSVNDMIENSSDWNGEKIRAFDEELKANNISTLTELRRQYSKQFSRIMKRGKINAEGDYYHVKGILDGSPESLSAEEFSQLSIMIEEYEQRVVKKLKKS